MATTIQRDSLDRLEDKIEYLLKFVTIMSELVLLLGLAYAGFKLAHKGATPEILDQIWLVSQVLALDLSAPGLFAMAAQARERGDDRRARWAIRIAIVLIIMSILTMVEGAVTSYLPGIPKPVILYVTLFMMIIRAGAAVGYSVFRRLHKAAHTAPPIAAQAVQVAPVQPEPQLIDYEEIARHLLPLITAQRTQESEPEEVVEEAAFVDTDQMPIVNIAEYRSLQNTETEEQQVVNTPQSKITQKLSTRSASSSATPGATKSAPTAKQKAQRIARRNPGISAPELANKAGISRQYASQILKQQA